MYRLKQLCLIIFALFIAVLSAQARLTINITQGVSQQIPVAVMPFKGARVSDAQIPDGIAAIIADDLRNSGRIASQTTRFPQSVESSKDIIWSKWQSDYILIGSIDERNGRYDVTYELVSKLSGNVLNARKFTNVQKDQLRLLAHTISNFLYEAITGSKGYFTSKLAYVDVENPYNVKKAVYQLIVADYDGFNPHVLLRQTKDPIMSPAWSKDGKYLAYVSYSKGNMAIYTIEVYTGVRKKIASYKGINSSPAFSPDGNTLAMALSQGYSENSNIYLMNLANDKLYKKLTLNGINTAPAFSPSGKELAFVSDRGGNPQIYTTDLSSKYPSSERLTYGAKQAFDPQYTPNGQSIVFMYQQNSGTQIAKVDLNSKKITVLTNGVMDASPSVSPDGNMIIYAKGQESGGANLAMVSIDGKVQISLPSNTQGAIQSPAWSPAV
ncbi:Tol-Pal system beta propeller repeat protein TolB [Caedibacter taeniospiralis]|uniref:Tol-Pal system beta propeller repeat protein TolB n=1 Tax=Caedibacter taeniospiralis TaxID=28907 RepID=UPI000C27FA52|nr:Tol-Pal system beta propeller repeat protein TolB [Caedibacter taeniospiralis]